MYMYLPASAYSPHAVLEYTPRSIPVKTKVSYYLPYDLHTTKADGHNERFTTTEGLSHWYCTKCVLCAYMYA